jgi:phage-related protein
MSIATPIDQFRQVAEHLRRHHLSMALNGIRLRLECARTAEEESLAAADLERFLERHPLARQMQWDHCQMEESLRTVFQEQAKRAEAKTTGAESPTKKCA